MKIEYLYLKEFKSIKSNFIFLLMLSSMTRSHTTLFILSTKPCVSIHIKATSYTKPPNSILTHQAPPANTRHSHIFYLLSCLEPTCNITFFRDHRQTLKNSHKYMYVNGFISSNIRYLLFPHLKFLLWMYFSFFIIKLLTVFCSSTNQLYAASSGSLLSKF